MPSFALLALGLVLAPARQGQDTVAPRTARVTYLTSATAYLDAGRDEGLAVGARLTVRRTGTAIGELVVTDLSTHRAAASIARADVPLVVGDSAWYLPAAGAPPEAVASAPTATRRRGTLPVHGRVGVRYLYSRGVDGLRTLSQPALDLRLDGAAMGGTPIGVSVDVRARWTNSGGAGVVTTSDELARVYQATLFYDRAGGPVRAVIGRQMSPTLATVSFLDGVLLEARGRSWSVGVLGGTEPDPVTFGWSGSVRDVGGYAQWRSRPGTSRRWTASVGAMGSYTEGHANREFAFVQAGYTDARLTAFLAQEVDYYRPWKVAAGEPSAISPTSTYANVRVRVLDALSVAAGYDNRRNVRLFRDAVSPETEFDDAFRRGAWGSILLRPARRLLLGFEGRTSGGGEAGNADAYSLTAGTTGLGRMALSLRGRGTRYRSASADGWLASLALGAVPTARVSLELNGGLRSDRNPANDPPTSQLWWVGGYVDIALRRSLYLTLSGTHEQGGLDANDQAYGALSYRF